VALLAGPIRKTQRVYLTIGPANNDQSLCYVGRPFSLQPYRTIPSRNRDLCSSV